MYQTNKIYLKALQLPVIFNLIEVEFLTIYLVKNAEKAFPSFKISKMPPSLAAFTPITKPSDKCEHPF